MTEIKIDHADFHAWRDKKHRDWPCHLCVDEAMAQGAPPSDTEISPQHTRMFGRASKPKPIY